MTDKTHEITPPPELVEQWRKDAPPLGLHRESWIATAAARWGFEQHTELDAAELEAKLQKARDEELEACCAWLRGNDPYEHDYHQMLRDARRPKPPSLKEQLLQALERVPGPGADPAYLRTWADREGASLADTIRHALEQLND